MHPSVTIVAYSYYLLGMYTASFFNPSLYMAKRPQAKDAKR